jgi:hypothetical protein
MLRTISTDEEMSRWSKAVVVVADRRDKYIRYDNVNDTNGRSYISSRD